MTTASATPRRRSKPGHDPVSERQLIELCPSPENEQLYRPVEADDPETQELAESIREHGVMEPLVVTLDGFILSGHRRHAAAILAGLDTVPVRVEPIRHKDDPDRFVLLLREHNRQREKSRSERLREELVSTDPEQAYQALIEHRRQASEVSVAKMRIVGSMNRSRISKAKRPFLDAVKRVLRERHEFLPLSDRQIHYALLNHPPLCHASKPGSVYENTPQCYKKLVDLLTRARLEARIPMGAIQDETRPVVTWSLCPSPAQFIRKERKGLFRGYWRDLLQSQPNHIEVVVEKNTVLSIVKPVAEQYCISVTSGRGYCSLAPRAAMADRFEKSGKEKFILIILSDFDPDGVEIAQSLARSLRDDFFISKLHPIQAALTGDQVDRLDLPVGMPAKRTSSQYRKFVERYGDQVYELEALEPAQLQEELREVIDSVLDVTAFNAEVDSERQDAVFLEGVRRQVLDALGAMDLEDD